MHELKIQKIGDALAVVLPPELLAEVHLSEGQTVLVTGTNTGDLHISPKRIDKMAVVRDIALRYRNTLTELSK